MTFRDTSAQDIPLAAPPYWRRHRRRLIYGGGALLGVLLLGVLLTRYFAASGSVSLGRLEIATVQQGAFVRDIAADGRVVAAVSPTLYAAGTVRYRVQAGDAVQKGGVPVPERFFKPLYTRRTVRKGIPMSLLFALVVVIVALVVLSKLVRIVPQGYEWTVERFGKYVATLEPGLHFLVPFIYAVGRKVNMMEQVLDVASQDVITKDNAVVKVDGVVFYQVLDAAKAAYEVANLELAVINLVMTNIRTVLGSLDLDESLSKRDEINSRLLRVVDEATHPWGLKITRIELKDIQPPRDLVDSMARQMKAEREKRANILEAEGFRQAAILKAEGEKQSAILSAEGRREASFREAEARERLGAADAKATELVSVAIAQGDVNALNYFVAIKYIEALKVFGDSPNQKTLLLPMEATGVLGSLAGIVELVRSAQAQQEQRKAATPGARS